MGSRVDRIAAGIALIAGLWLADPAGAALSATRVHAPWLAQAQSALSADEAAALVRAASGGRILGVRSVSGAGGPLYHVKVLLDGGRVRVYVVDALSGTILQ